VKLILGAILVPGFFSLRQMTQNTAWPASMLGPGLTFKEYALTLIS